MGERQPGSSFKIFTLAAALEKGVITPYTPFDSKPITIHFVKKDGNAFAAPNGTGRFAVRDFGNVYSGWIPMTVATATSDNSVFAQLGTEQQVGTAAVAKYARLMGIRSPISTNPSMILGGLNTGVTALDMAHAYSTVANGGKETYNTTLGDIKRGPIGIDSISNCDVSQCKQSTITNAKTMATRQVVSPEVASTITELLHGPVDDSYGTGTAAAIPGVDVVGKTGTTSNYVDAWFVGWTPQMTVAVWVGYPDSGKPMTTQYNGGPVEGGTFPAVIWRNFMVSALQIMQDEAEHKQTDTITAPSSTYSGSITSPAATSTTATSSTTPSTVTTPQTYGTNNGGTSNSSSGTANQTETLPQTTSPPPASSGTPTTGSNGGTGL
jgi:penicillin-binding protein 1A